VFEWLEDPLGVGARRSRDESSVASTRSLAALDWMLQSLGQGSLASLTGNDNCGARRQRGV